MKNKKRILSIKTLALAFNILKIIIIILTFLSTFYFLFKNTSFDFLTIIFMLLCILSLITIEKVEQYIVYKYYK